MGGVRRRRNVIDGSNFLQELKKKQKNNRTLIKEDNKELDAEYVEVFVPVSILFFYFIIL
jgi:hypothetical protein